MDKAKKKKRWVWQLLCVALLVGAFTILVLSLLDNRPVFYRTPGRPPSEVMEFFLANEDKFKYVINRLIEANYENLHWHIGVTKRTREVVFSTDRFETYISPEALGITVDDELIEYLRIILTEGKFGRISIKKAPATTYSVEYPMIFDVSFGFNNPVSQGAIYYYYSTERSPGTENMINIKGNWYM